MSAHSIEVERLNKLAQDAILSLTDEIGFGDDPVAFVCAAYVESRREIQKLRDRITALEEGECRFHCRMRKDMWQVGGVYVWEHWEKLGPPTQGHLNQMYDQWRKNDG